MCSVGYRKFKLKNIGINQNPTPWQKHISIPNYVCFFMLLFLSASTICAQPPKNPCAFFDSTALQLALAQNQMVAPLNLNQIQLALGAGNKENDSVVATYTWVYKNRMLLVRTTDDAITTKMLTGTNDGSSISGKMEQINEMLKTATSIWSIKEIQRQLGQGNISRQKLQRLSWNCGIGLISVKANQNGDLVEAVVSYKGSQDLIEGRLGPNHPEWDSKTGTLGSYVCVWQRYFEAGS